MSSRPLPRDERLLDLLVQQTTEGLSEAEQRELEDRLAEHPELGVDELAPAAAAAQLALLEAEAEPVEPLPEALRRRLEHQAKRRFAATWRRRAAVDRAARQRRGPHWNRLGWYAAAAMLLIALFVGWPRTVDRPAPATLTAQQQRAAMLAEAPDAIRAAWAPPEEARYAQVTGDVVWSYERQEGYLLLRGLPPNDPTVEQYQLWIVDPQRDQHPIDGGVFDVRGPGEIVVPIDAKLEVVQAAAFAITLEQPGGVVVSDGPLLVVASVGGSA